MLVDNKLNVLYISNLYPPYIIGGAEIITSFLAEYIAGQGAHVSVVSTEDPSILKGKEFTRQFHNGVEVIRFFPKNLYWIYRKEKPPLIKKLAWHIRDAWNTDAARKVCKILYEIRPDVMHTHNIDSFSPSIWYEAKKLKIPLVHTTHDCHLICPHSTMLNKKQELCSHAPLPCRIYRKWYSERASIIDVLCSPSKLLLNLHKTFGFRAREFQVIQNGIPHDLSNENLNTESNDGNLHILYMGRLNIHKGIHTLLEAFKMIPKDIPIIINIAGTGPLETDVIKAVNCDSRIRFHGFVSGKSKQNLLKYSDLLVLPTICNDNAPISVLEAYRVGLAVLSTDTGGLSEIVENDNTGLLFPRGDAKALCSLLSKLVHTPELLKKLKSGAKAAGKKYTIEQMAKEYLEIYYNLTGK